MNKNEYQTMAEREREYWWHVGRIHIVNKQLKKITKDKKKVKILNVGCGTGGTVPVLEKYGEVVNVDVSEEAIKFMKKSGYKARKADGISLPYNDKEFDVVVALDILEHVKEDKKALKEWARVLKPGGEILLTVPAFQWLWSDHDVSLHHFRRYTRPMLREKVKSVKRLRVVKLSYAIVFSFLLVVGFRFLNKILGRKMDEETSYVDLPGFVNSLFSWFLKIEAWFLQYINFPFGTSILLRAKREK